ncbi:MAG: hypothetical protein H2174_08030 [Vampirovibrio sp.]|nr:hypothetical protein [Vampirovibrio sp.]
MLQFLQKTSLIFSLCLLLTTAFTPAVKADEPYLSPIAKLNLQKQQRQQCQVFLPSTFRYGQENLLTVRGIANQSVKVYYRFLPFDPTDKTEGVQSKTLVLDGVKPVGTIALPVVKQPKLEGEEEPTSISATLKNKKKKTIDNNTGVKPAEVANQPENRYTSVQLQFVTEAGTPVEVLLGSGQPTDQRTFPLVGQHQSTGSAFMPTIGGLDSNAMRGIQTTADFAHDEEKRQRLQYDGKINRDRQIDRNSLVGGVGAFGVGGGNP